MLDRYEVKINDKGQLVCKQRGSTKALAIISLTDGPKDIAEDLTRLMNSLDRMGLTRGERLGRESFASEMRDLLNEGIGG